MGNDTNATSVGSRLRSERARLGYNIRDFAERAGVSKSTQGNYEHDVGLPDADYLNRIAELGAEVFWIMRGEVEDDEAREKRAENYPPEVREMIANYERCPPEVRQSLRTLAAASAYKINKD